MDAEVAEQPSESTVTEYVPDVETEIACVVSPFDHVFPVVALEVNVTLFPEQKVVVLLAMLVGVVGIGFTVTFTLADVAEQPAESTVTE